MRLSITELVPDFPQFRVAAIIADGLTISEQRPAPLEAWIGRREAEIRKAFGGSELSERPGIAAWRRAYRAFGVKRTSYRSSVERLVKNVLAGRDLPRINAFVDAYNAVSLAACLPIGADDLDKVVGDIAFRYAVVGDDFHDMAPAAGEDAFDPPKPGEVVYADAKKVLCRRWNWRQDARSLVTTATRRAVVTIQSNGWGDVEGAAAELVSLLETACGAWCHITIADAANPDVALAGT